MNKLHYYTAKEIQLKSLSRIIGGHNILGIAPEGAGKTTTYVLGVLMRLKYTKDEAPKVLVLAANDDKVDEIVDRFFTISQNKELYIMGLKTDGDMEEEIDGLVRGVDIVVSTPSRARAVYLKLGLNLNRIQTFVIDDAEEIAKQGMQTLVRELAQSCGKVQYLAFSTVENKKLHRMIDDFMPFATVIEVEELDEKTETYELLLYQVPNFLTKINLLNLLMQDKDVFDKVVIFVNTRSTAQQLIQHIDAEKGEVALLHPSSDDDAGFDDINIFKQASGCRMLIIANESTTDIDLTGIPFIFHFELPEDDEVFVHHIAKRSDDEVIAITFASDDELLEIKTIEESIGKEIPVMPLPDDLIIDQRRDSL
ncbi:DEAD/DEAH box helicase [Albibacterium profundi]|uniref:DEAD/DEAH box helicase n=1 Tax=Albibacterium profundi TaxID=3134906 RepID=A0ABV5CJA0_9SPHI